MPIKVTKEELDALTSDEMFEFSERLLHSLVGNYEEMNLDEESEQYMRALAVADMFTDLTGDLFGEKHDTLYTMMKDMEDERMTAATYLYCNWRVWATWKKDEALAKKYQEVCDIIDDYVFDNWPKDKIKYFIEKTD